MVGAYVSKNSLEFSNRNGHDGGLVSSKQQSAMSPKEALCRLGYPVVKGHDCVASVISTQICFETSPQIVEQIEKLLHCTLLSSASLLFFQLRLLHELGLGQPSLAASGVSASLAALSSLLALPRESASALLALFVSLPSLSASPSFSLHSTASSRVVYVDVALAS